MLLIKPRIFNISNDSYALNTLSNLLPNISQITEKLMFCQKYMII